LEFDCDYSFKALCYEDPVSSIPQKGIAVSAAWCLRIVHGAFVRSIFAVDAAMD
jgi:hypothetical protein